MSETEGQATGTTGALDEPSPSEKLEDKPVTGALTPGVQNPESEEIKNEKSPNTE